MWVRRKHGRRASDHWPSLESMLATLVVIAWTWGLFELARLYVR